MIKAALIGVSGYAKLYLQNLIRLQENGLLSLEAVLIIHADEHKKEIEHIKSYGASVFTNPDSFFEAISDKIDLCCIPTSIHSHAELSLKALKANCNVLVEKPAAATNSDIALMMKAAIEHKKRVFVGYQDVYHTSSWQIKEQILSGEIGELKSISLIGLWPRSVSYFSRNEWAGKLKLGNDWIYDSVLHNAFGHFLNLMCFWSGSTLNGSAKIENVSGELYRTMPIESFDTCSIKVDTQDGKSLFAHLSHSSKTSIDPEISIQGSSGLIKWTPGSYEVNGKVIKVAESTVESLNLSRTTMFDHIVTILGGEEKHHCNLEIASVPTQIVNMLHDSLPITAIGNGLVSSYENDLGKHLAINNLEELMLEAHRKNELMPSLTLSV